MSTSEENSNGDQKAPKASGSKENQGERNLKKLQQNTNKFMENFNPETSARERRKLNRKISNSKKNPAALYDEKGIHIATQKDMCDCLIEECPGCFYPCQRCSSTKCGNECRVGRKYVYEQIDYEGCNISIKNPLLKP